MNAAIAEKLLAATVAADEHDANADMLLALGHEDAADEQTKLRDDRAVEARWLRASVAEALDADAEAHAPALDPDDPRPVLYVDVDGVLNVFQSFDHKGEKFTANGYQIRVPSGVRKRIARLSEHFQMAWGTAWEHKAPRYLSPHLGFGADWPVADYFNKLHGTTTLPLGVKLSDALGEGRTWKLAGLLEHAATHEQPFAWLDDDLGSDAYAAFAQITASGRPAMLSQTDPAFGLTDGHVEALIDWVQTLEQGGAAEAA